MFSADAVHWMHKVALLAEGVGRNIDQMLREYKDQTSPSSRRAWVEISSHRRSAALR